MMALSSLIRSFSTVNNDKILLEQLSALVKELKSTNSINSKVEMIKNKPELRRILEIIYCPKKRFYVTSNSLNDVKDTKHFDNREQNLYDMLKMLSDRVVRGDSAVSLVQEYIKLHPEYEELIKNIIDKNLKARVGHELIKRSFDAVKDYFIPCSLGYPIEKHLEYLKKSLEKGEKWFISRKYDGIRAFLAYDHENKAVKLLTRQMKPVTGLNPAIIDTFSKSLRDLKESVVLDGELVFMLNGREEFSKTMSLVKSIEIKPIYGLEFRSFDIVNWDGKFSERQEKLHNLITKHFSDSDVIKFVHQELLNDFNYEKLIKESSDLGYEGFIIRRDCELKNGRSRDLLKIKPFQDGEFKVIDCAIGPMRILDDDGVEKTETVLLSITIDFKGIRVSVGSGFSNSQRLEFAKVPEMILNKIVTIRYQSESKVEGRQENSLRFPVFKVLHGNKRRE
jgi:DNA ligase 1